MHLRYWLLMMGVLSSCGSWRTPVGFWSRNRTTAAGQRHGPWREYFDEAETRPANRGRYRHGRPVGHWRYYGYSGRLDHDERYRRGGRMLVRHYHPNGQLARRGQARMVSTTDTVHYFWYGYWQLYDSTGARSGWERYEQGRRVGAGTGAAKPVKNQ